LKKKDRQAKMEEMKAKRAQMDADMKKFLLLSNMINGRLTEKQKWREKSGNERKRNEGRNDEKANEHGCS
jgi:hypothetical protein